MINTIHLKKNPPHFKVKPHGIAAMDGRIRTGDRILQVKMFVLVLVVKMMQT